MYTIDDLLVFMKLAHTKNYTTTAKITNMDRTTLSRKIKELEKKLKNKLIFNYKNKLQLTAYGEELQKILITCNGNLEEIKEEIDTFLESKKEIAGELTIVLPMALGVLITPKLPNFMKQYPKINLNIFYSSKKISIIEENINIAILNYIPEEQFQKYKYIYSLYAKMYCSKTYAEKYGIPKKITELSEHLITGNITSNLKIQDSAIFTNIKTQETCYIQAVRRIATNSTPHNLELLTSNEVICALLNDESDSLGILKNNTVIDIFPDWYAQKVNFYLVKNPYSNEVKVHAFCKFIDEILKNN